jgi:hypothetical protein
MKNKLKLLDTAEGWIAVYSGTTVSGEIVSEEEAHNIAGGSDLERTQNALIIWGADIDETDVEIS